MKKFCYDFDNPRYKIIKHFKKKDNARIIKKLKLYSQKTFNELKLKVFRKLKTNELKKERMKSSVFRASFSGQTKNIYQLYVYKTRLFGIIINDVFIVISVFKK